MSMIHPIQVVAVTGGKGGVGKTNVAVNLSLALTQLERRVVLLDADLGLANVDVQFGIQARRTIADVLENRCDLSDILIRTPGGVDVIPASSGIRSVVNMGPQEHAGIINAFSTLADDLDVLLIDTAAGIADNVVSFVRACQEIVVVVCDEPSSITDAYALIKLLNRDCQKNDFRVLANMTRSAEEGKRLFEKFVRVTERFLDVNLRYAGDIPYDEAIRDSARRRMPVMEASPGSPAAAAYRRLAENMIQWPVATQPNGHLEFFVERLVQRTV